MLRTLLLLLLAASASAQDFTTRFERSGGKESAPYAEVIAFYKALDKAYGSIYMEEAGPTDTDYPLHIVYFSGDRHFDRDRWKREGKAVLLINNGIHPGEPDGIDASMMLLRDAAAGKIRIPDNMVLAVIPVFNIGGALNRGRWSRANQNGPVEYGFRGNAQNLDLNRDFTKMDALETQSLVRLITRLDPVMFIDNHVSNGADYQHVMTLLSTQADKLGDIMGPYLRDTLEPAIYAGMKKRGYDLVPYVNSFEGTPDKGWPGFLDGPRYASGFAALFQIFSFVPETHMLKPFKQRVEATYALMQTFIEYAGKEAGRLQAVRQEQRASQQFLIGSDEPLVWTIDSSTYRGVAFKGYEGRMKPSDVSGQPRLFYDRSRPLESMVRVYDHFKGANNTVTRFGTYYPVGFYDSTAAVPSAYIVPSGWKEVLKRLRAAGVSMVRFPKDDSIEVAVARITGFETLKRPYEKHYLHYNIGVEWEQEKVLVHKGDWYIEMAGFQFEQPANRFLFETLEPNAPDGFFAWNFFDAVLQQKEHYSDYVFEDEAAALLKNDPDLLAQFREEKEKDPKLAADGAAQLDWVYHHSPRYEAAHMRYPVYKIVPRIHAQPRF